MWLDCLLFSHFSFHARAWKITKYRSDLKPMWICQLVYWYANKAHLKENKNIKRTVKSVFNWHRVMVDFFFSTDLLFSVINHKQKAICSAQKRNPSKCRWNGLYASRRGLVKRPTMEHYKLWTDIKTGSHLINHFSSDCKTTVCIPYRFKVSVPRILRTSNKFLVCIILQVAIL